MNVAVGTPRKAAPQETSMSLDNTSHPGRPGLDELVPSRYALRVGEIDVLVVSDGVLSLPGAMLAHNGATLRLCRLDGRKATPLGLFTATGKTRPPSFTARRRDTDGGGKLSTWEGGMRAPCVGQASLAEFHYLLLLDQRSTHYTRSLAPSVAPARLSTSGHNARRRSV